MLGVIRPCLAFFSGSIAIAFLALAALGWPSASAKSAAPPTAPEPSAGAGYGVGDWPQSNGNHRAIVHVAQPAAIVQVRIPWRRRDENPQDKEIIVLDAKTNRRVENVLRVDINREFGLLLFQPGTGPGDYYVYYMPFRMAGAWWAPVTKYLPPTETGKAEWLAAARPLAERVRSGSAAEIPSAKVVEIQAINDFHRFDPMEVVATAAEMKRLLAENANRTYLVFAEDRKFPIRMTDGLPLRWIEAGPSDAFTGEACRGEFYPYQLGVFAANRALESVTVEFGDLTSAAGKTIPAAAMRCFNLGGVDWLGRRLTKVIGVPRGRVQALWCGIAVPNGAEPGTYRGMVTLRAKGESDTPLKISLTVTDRVLEDCGDSEPWRMSRLRWLDSTIGLDDELFAPYTPVALAGQTVRILGRTAKLADTGLLANITSEFSRNVDATDGALREILAAPMRLAVESAAGTEVDWKPRPTKVTLQAPGAVAWETSSTAGPLAARLPRKNGMRRLRQLQADARRQPGDRPQKHPARRPVAPRNRTIHDGHGPQRRPAPEAVAVEMGRAPLEQSTLDRRRQRGPEPQAQARRRPLGPEQPGGVGHLSRLGQQRPGRLRCRRGWARPGRDQRAIPARTRWRPASSCTSTSAC